jgi:hypothetical protein
MIHLQNREQAVLSCSHLRTDITMLHKNQTNTLIYVKTTLFILLYSYMFQASRAHPQVVLICKSGAK